MNSKFKIGIIVVIAYNTLRTEEKLSVHSITKPFKIISMIN